ncbi:unnamed protein product [Toxocara canis]|uniref:Essential MCU regulator, mitochondrial n=1 Tax=Toxocara canis TaxID=6265 RepID=A0A183UVZ6_TOXCA|nr:unnamed protein product [Toxocara canis]
MIEIAKFDQNYQQSFSIAKNLAHVSKTFRFGDKFPGASVGNDKEAQEKLVITSVYLLFGMALLAMCFNLAQEEVVNKVSWLANKFKSREDDEYD